MKNFMKNTLTTTALTLGCLTVAATLLGGTALYLRTVYQHFGINFLIHLGFLAVGRWEKGPALSVALELSWTAATVFASGYLFDWYSSTPVWIVTVILLCVYLPLKWLDGVQVTHYANDINRMIRHRQMDAQEE